jgi:hypothetical protein
MTSRSHGKPDANWALPGAACSYAGSNLVAVDVMLCYVHMAYVHVAIQALLVIVFPQLTDPLQVSICMDPSLNFTVV